MNNYTAVDFQIPLCELHNHLMLKLEGEMSVSDYADFGARARGWLIDYGPIVHEALSRCAAQPPADAVAKTQGVGSKFRITAPGFYRTREGEKVEIRARINSAGSPFIWEEVEVKNNNRRDYLSDGRVYYMEQSCDIVAKWDEKSQDCTELDAASTTAN